MVGQSFQQNRENFVNVVEHLLWNLDRVQLQKKLNKRRKIQIKFSKVHQNPKYLDEEMKNPAKGGNF